MENCTNYELQLLVNKLNSSNIPAKGTGYNELEIFYNESNKDIVLSLLSTIKNSKTYNYETKKENKVYNMEKINSLDKYDIYLSGATPVLKIENPENKTGNELIIFRDSYASSLVPLFIPKYSKITLIDTRYISPKLLPNYVEFNNQDILFMYSTLIINNSYSLK